ncbi:MAG: hypothetical protein ACKVZ6_04710 [Kineosporiaceae bacterium]|jgi:hypothetical protein
MRKTLAAAVAALSLLIVSPGAAHAGSGSSSSAWPTATAPLPAGAILSQSGSKAVVLSPTDVLTTRQALDAAYLNAGYTVGASTGLPRWYKSRDVQVNVFFAALEGGRSQWTLNLVS